MGALDLIRKGAKGVKNAPFFSKADVVLDELQRGKGTGDEFLTELVKKGVKPTELKERGLDKALKGKPKMAKAEVQKIFEQKAPPKLQETVLGDAPDYDEFLEAKAQEIYGVDWFDLRKEEQRALDRLYGDLPVTQYERYKTPGGENYREILLKLPAFDDKRLMELEAQIRREEKAYNDPMQYQWFRDKVAEVQRLKEEKAAAGAPYVSSHYKQDPNLLAHIRVQDFKTPEGKKVLLVDEVQSDWHQEGRKRGYREGFDRDSMKEEMKDMIRERGALVKEFMEYQAKHGDITPEMQAKWNEFKVREDALEQKKKEIAGQVPDAPFKKNWHELAMKRVLDYAAENGYDTVAITPGAEQAKRYDLSKQISKINFDKFNSGQNEFKAWDKDGKKVFEKYGASQEEVADYIGKEAAEKLFAATPKDNLMGGERYSLIGEDLQVGGEGMKGFYDKILPDYLNNYGKQYGAQVREIDLTYAPDAKQVQQGAADDALLSGLGVDVPVVKAPTYHAFDITPQMREEIKTKGQPLYSKIGVPGAEATAGAGAATMGSQMFDENNEQSVQNPVHFTENPDAMLLELMQRN